jgi:hypothetical protein
MDKWLIKAFQETTAGFCIQDEKEVVLYQNLASKTFCGNLTGKTCPGSCFRSSKEHPGHREWAKEGIRFHPNFKIGSRRFDAVFLNAPPFRMILVYPRWQKLKERLDYFKHRGLSRREMQVVALCVEGLTNSQIAQKLGISKATLKTHMNKIYRKVPETKSQGWRQWLQAQ